MYELVFTKQFISDFNKIKDKNIRKQIYLKIEQLKIRFPIGKKLKGTNYFRIRVGNYRIVYELLQKNKIRILKILQRKRNYEDLF